MADYLTFKDLYETIEKYLKVDVADTAYRAIIKDSINMVYLNEMLSADSLYPLFWMLDFDDSLNSVAPATISAITKADPGVITTAAAHGLVVGDVVGIYNIAGMTELNNRIFKVATIPLATTLDLIDLEGNDAIASSAFTTYVSGGTIHHRGLTLGASPGGENIGKILPIMRWHGQSTMKQANILKLEEERDSWLNDSTARPEKWWHKKVYQADGTVIDLLLWMQGADAAYDLRYWYEKRPPRLSADADVPQMPSRFHTGIIAGTMTRLAETNVQVENPSIWSAIYAGQIQAIKDFNRDWWQNIEENEEVKRYLA